MAKNDLLNSDQMLKFYMSEKEKSSKSNNPQRMISDMNVEYLIDNFRFKSSNQNRKDHWYEGVKSLDNISLNLDFKLENKQLNETL